MLNTTANKDAIRNLSLKQVRASMMQLQAHQTFNDAYRIGQLYNYMVDTKLAQKANYRGAMDYFSRHFRSVPHSTLYLYSVVARHFSERVCTRFGTTPLSLLLTYEAVAGIQVNHDEPGDTLIKLPSAGGSVMAKPFSECSVEEMRRALRRLRNPGSGQAVKARSSQGKAARGQASHRQAEVVIHFKNIPRSQVEKLSAALMGQLRALRVKARVA